MILSVISRSYRITLTVMPDPMPIYFSMPIWTCRSRYTQLITVLLKRLFLQAGNVLSKAMLIRIRLTTMESLIQYVTRIWCPSPATSTHPYCRRKSNHTILTASNTRFRIQAELDAYEGDSRVFSKSWDKHIPRRFV
jgi:hypothetical protein